MPEQPQAFPPIGEILRRKGIWLSKRKSQHFLQRQETCMEIAQLAELGAQDLAIEVGAGLGNLTVELAARAGRVVSVEMDHAFTDWHEYLQASYPALEFIYDDFLKVDLESLVEAKNLGGRVCGVGNLPYQITSDILFRFVNSPRAFDTLVFMVQKEVAERVAAGPAARAAGALTYKIALRYKARVAMKIAPGQFLPPPKVDSAVMVLTPLSRPFVTDPEQRDHLYRILDRLFTFRRKTLSHGLLQGQLCGSREEAEAVLSAANIDAKRRPETLELDEVLALGQALKDSAP